MGTGGTTALLSPEVRAGLAFRCFAAKVFDTFLSNPSQSIEFQFNCSVAFLFFTVKEPGWKRLAAFDRFSDIYIQEFLQLFQAEF